MIRLVIVDDQSLVRQGLKSLLSLENDLAVVGQGADGDEAISLAESLQPDVILMDIRMPKTNGVAATQTIHSQNPKIKVLVLTTYDDDELIVQAMQAGASGYLLKDLPSEHLAAAIRAIHNGYTQFGPTIAPKLISLMSAAPIRQDDRQLLPSFTDRERQILKLIGKGKSNKEIARQLYLTEGTVKNHVTRILSQLNLRDRTQAALWPGSILSSRFLQLIGSLQLTQATVDEVLWTKRQALTCLSVI